MIKFRCSGCQKAIGVDEKYAGRLIKCPSCQNPTRVPAADGDAAPVPPTAQSAPAATMARVAAPTLNPICPSCQSELFNPSDTLCGVCGHLLDQAPLPRTPAGQIPMATMSATAAPVAATAAGIS